MISRLIEFSLAEVVDILTLSILVEAMLCVLNFYQKQFLNAHRKLITRIKK